MSELKPCPFCGGEAEVFSSIFDVWRVVCKNNCRAMEDPTDKAAAITAWNTRAPVVPDGMRPIATAPKNMNTWVLARHLAKMPDGSFVPSSDSYALVRWDDDLGKWWEAGGDTYDKDYFIDWIPNPAAPKPEAG